MSLMDFVKVITGLGLGFIATMALFAIGCEFMEIVEDGEDVNVFIIVMAVLIWLTVSYGTVTWVM